MTSKRKKADTELGTKILRNMARVIEREREKRGLNKKEMAELIDYKLSLVGLAGFQDYYPSEISGGMQKRAALARAIALDPELLFFDEPSAGLDPLSSARLDELILQIRDSMGGTVVIVTHELASIFTIATNAVFLDAETKTQLDCGDPRRLLHHSEHETVRNFLARGELGLARDAVVVYVFGHAADAVAAHLGFAAVGVEHPHAGVGALRWADQDQAVAPDPPMAVADGARQHGHIIGNSLREAVHVDVVVARTLHLDERQHAHLRAHQCTVTVRLVAVNGSRSGNNRKSTNENSVWIS